VEREILEGNVINTYYMPFIFEGPEQTYEWGIRVVIIDWINEEIVLKI